MIHFSQLAGRLSFAMRFAISACFFSIPIGVLFYFNIDQLSEKIDFARGEIAGDRFQRPAVRLVRALADYETAVLAGSDVKSARQQIDDLVGQMEKADGEVGALLAFTPAALKDAGLENVGVAAVKSKWQALSGESKPDPRHYEQLMSDIRGLIGHAGDTSNLTLDPEMDSYYLADITSVSMAQSLNRIGSVAVSFNAASDPTGAAIMSAELKESDFDRITGDFDTALKENAKSLRGASPTLKSAVDAPLGRYKAEVQKLIDLLTAAGKGKSQDREQASQATAAASQASLDLFDKTIDELDAVLRMRISGFERYRLKIVSGTIVAIGFAVCLLILTVRSVTGPLAVAVAHVETVAQGDLCQELPAGFLDRRDETGTLARAMGKMSARLRQMIGEISGEVGLLSSAATALQANSARMTSESQHASDKAHSVAAAAEEMSSNVSSVASGMEHAAANLTDVAGATDQMTATIAEISGNSEKARRITGEAREQAALITEKINHMGEAARGIGRVIDAIDEISAQTSLLALNAAIEAARAGAAGKGFAVVAAEIKALAQQAANATGDIKERVAGVRQATAAGVEGIGMISEVISQVSGIVSSIAAAIEQQTATTKDISRNLAEASVGVGEASERISQSSQVSREISRDIGGVDHAASEISAGSGKILAGSDELSRISQRLQQTVANFRL